MSARLLRPVEGRTYAPFTIPARIGAIPGGETELRHSTGLDGEQNWGTGTEIDSQVRTTLEAAQKEADRLVAEAQDRVAQIEQDAFQKGLLEARAKINEEVDAAASDLREQFVRTLTELESLYPLIATRSERDLVKLALEIARKVVHREVTTDPDIVISLARVALERLHPRAVATVLLHPDDFEYVSAHRQSLSGSNAIEIVADRAVGRGGCIIQSEHGDIDARIEQQFASIERGFFE